MMMPTIKNDFMGFGSLEAWVAAHLDRMDNSFETQVGCFRLIVETISPDEEGKETHIFFLVRDLVFSEEKVSFLQLIVKGDEFGPKGEHIIPMDPDKDGNMLDYFDRVRREQGGWYTEHHIYYPSKVHIYGRFEYHNETVIDNTKNELTADYHQSSPPSKDNKEAKIVPFNKKPDKP